MKLKLPKIFNISSKENKFKDYSYKYHIKMTKEDFLESNVKNARKVKLNDGKVEFYSNYKNNYNNDNTEVINQYKLIFREKILKNLVLIISVMISLLIFLITPFFIRDIRYKNGTFVKDERVLREVYSKMNKIGSVYFPKEDLNTISADLRAKYVEYAWIEINRKAAVLEIGLEKMDAKKNESVDLSVYGDIIAKENGYIEKMEIKRGVVVKNIRETVKKGEVIVSGTLNNGDAAKDSPLAVRAEGKIMARVLLYKNMSIPKKSTLASFETLKDKVLGIKTSKGYKWFGEPVSYDKVVNQTLLQLFKIEIIKSSFYVKKDNFVIRTKDDAFSYAQSLFTKEFWKNTTCNDEYIKRFELIGIKETEDEYLVRCLVETYQNIAEFRAYDF